MPPPRHRPQRPEGRRLPDELADAAEAVARVKVTSVNALIVDRFPGRALETHIAEA